VLFVSRTRYELPLSETLRRRFDALSGVMDWRQLATSATGRALRDDRFTLVSRFPVARLDGVAFYVLLPIRVAREIRAFRPDVVIVQGAEDTTLALLGRRMARSTAPIVFDVHGDWRHSTRVFGSSARRLFTPLSGALAKVAVRRADGVRTVSGFTTRLVREQGVEPIATFPAYMDLAPFTDTPPAPFPARPAALFVGVLERYKAVDVLAAAWRKVSAAVPTAQLHLVGRGAMQPVVEQMVAEGGGNVTWTPRLSTPEVAAALDTATLLVLPSRREGMGRVLVESLCRGRPVVGTASGGIPDVVEDQVSGLLVPVDDADALAAALEVLLSDPPTAARLGAGAHAAAADWVVTPEQFATRTRELVDRALERR
jgi:glycosyltransferase involved in cell wall biosynthesis